MAARYTNSKISNAEHAQLFGETCRRLAEELKYDDVRSLTGEDVFSRIEADPRHPCRVLYSWDDAKDARRQRVADTSAWITSLRYVSAPSSKHKLAVFLAAPAPVDGGHHVQRKVLREDVIKHDAIFSGAIKGQIKRIRDALVQLEALTASRRPTGDVQALRDEIRAAFLAYDSAGEANR
jgi:hypothetical protein